MNSKDNKKPPYFVIDARSLGRDSVLLTNSVEHTSCLFKTVHMKLLAEAYDSYFTVQEELNRLFNTRQSQYHQLCWWFAIAPLGQIVIPPKGGLANRSLCYW